jgi:tetratricopeptide (TPR) repeat protein
MLPLNPYVAGNPVGDSPAFIGRADVLREVARVLRRSQDNAIVLYGQRRIGKTSILQHLAAQLPREGPYRPIYFDLQDKADWPLGRVLQNLAREVAHALGQPDPDLGDAPAITFRQKWLPTVLDDLPEGCSLVLLFDEFDVLADPKGEQAGAAFFPYLRNLLASDPKRMQFVFVIGRNVDDLDTIALSLFKGTPYRRVSLLNREDTADLVRLSEGNDTLRWPDEAVERVWQLTNGHPFLTQQLCSHVWERAYDADDEVDVNAAVPDALDASRNTLEWLWDGLPPAERVVISALAEAGPGSITQDELEQLLHESGVRVVIRELQNAPELLQDWDLIEPADDGYRFRVELLRQWIAERKPLNRVQEELDRIEPVAENLYGAASGLYRGGQLDQAVPLLRQAIALNPNHVRANQLLADILLAQGQPDEARQLLERLYEYQPAAARSRLVQAYLTEAQAAEDDDERLALYGQVLNLNPRQPEATTGKQRIWEKRGDIALEDDDLETALEDYRKAGLGDKVAEIEQEIDRRDLAAEVQKFETLEQEGRYQDALDLAHQLAEKYPEEKEWATDLERLERKTRLADLYQRALDALQSGDRQTAQELLIRVISLEPGYEEATRYLHEAVTGVDVADLQNQLKAKKKSHRKFVVGGLY